MRPAKGETQRYKLERTLPDGAVKEQGPVSLRQAETALAGVLHDNLGVGKGDAFRVAARLRSTDIGESVEAHGYRFRLLNAEPAQ